MYPASQLQTGNSLSDLIDSTILLLIQNNAIVLFHLVYKPNEYIFLADGRQMIVLTIVQTWMSTIRDEREEQQVGDEVMLEKQCLMMNEFTVAVRCSF